MKKIEVKIPGKSPYMVYVGQGVFGKINKLIKENNLHSNILAVVDKHVYKLHHVKIKATFNIAGVNVKILELRSSEKFKTHETLHKIYSALQRNNFTRDSLILALGGGIIGDIAGFAAATYNRGIPYIQIPTTLLAAVDSSVGGKTGINFGSTKNSVGSFHHPEFVIADIEFFDTLPYEEILCGLGEIVKYGFLSDERFYSYVSKNINSIFDLKKQVIERLVSESIKFKRDVVAADEKEKSLRKILNLGHTFAHALEVEQNYKIKHGAAVIVGIACSFYLSNALGILQQDLLKKYVFLLKNFAGKIKIKSFDKNKIINIMLRDKKNEGNQIKFVLMQNIGKVLLDVEADRKSINYSLDKGIKLFS
ncbi:3-dehydroquinate synthase [Bacteroidota bacterium]